VTPVPSVRHITVGSSAISLANTYSSSSDVYISASFTTTTVSNEFGIIVHHRVGTYGPQFLLFRKAVAGYQLCFGYKDYNQISCSVTYSTLPAVTVGQPVDLKVRVSTSGTTKYYTFYSGATQFATYYITSVGWDSGDYGVYGTGDVSFRRFAVTTPTTIRVTFNDCGLTNDQIKDMIAKTTGASTTSVTIITKDGCYKKRDIQSQSITVNLIGEEALSSQDMASKLATSTHTATDAPVTTSITSAVPSAVQSTADLSLGAAIAISVIPVVVGLSVAAIVGIAVGSAVGAGAIGTGAYFGVKKYKERKNNTQVTLTVPKPEPKVVQIQEPVKTEPEPEQKPTKYKPKGASIDIFNLNPNDPTSITARNPGLKHNY
jgi:hypothetical protein